MDSSIHIAVLLDEAIDALRPHAGGRYVDGTLGGATHTRMLLERSSPDGRVWSFDVDPVALERAAETLKGYGDRWQGIESNFRFMDDELRRRGVDSVDGVLLDLGLSSDELARPELGISFQLDGPLDMRLGPKANDDGLTAAEIVNLWPVQDIAKVLELFGDEPWAKKIAEVIGETRRKGRLSTTRELADLVRRIVPRRPGDTIDPATKTFQALRIAVNDEVETLKLALAAATRILAPGGRLAVISFHSLEDRVAKRAFKESAELEDLTPTPIVPGDAELARNPRARSAKLRIAQKR